MTPTKIYLLFGAVLVIIIAAVLAIFSSPTKEPATSSSGFPVATSTGITQNTGGQNSGTSTVTSTAPMLTIATQNGSLAVNDFLHNGVTATDVANPGNYYLAGSPGYCTKNNVCPAGATSTDFIVTYDANAQFFTIALTKEPIGQARLDAQAFLETTLGIGQTQLCSLKYYLGTDVYTNSFYGGKNLGFSFCSGATELPQ